MSCLLESEVKSIKILHLEDDPVSQNIVQDLVRINYHSTTLLQFDTGISLGLTMPFEKPDVIIVDWHLKDCCAKDLLNTLKRFKGLIIVFSANDTNKIKSCIADKLGGIPHNFKVLSKYADFEGKPYQRLMSEVKRYASKIGKNL